MADVKSMLKDYLDGDFMTFINAGEFAEEIELDKIKIMAVVEHRTAEKSGNQNLNYPGLHGDFVEVYFKVSEYEVERQRLMKQGEICYLNGKRYTVEEITNEQGMAHLKLSEYRQNTVRMI